MTSDTEKDDRTVGMYTRHGRMASLRWVPFIICCVLIAWGLFRSLPPPDPFENSDKWGHFLAFGAFGLTARFAFFRAPVAVLWGVLLAVAPALELAQHWLQPVRQFSLWDAVANFLGVVLALLAWAVWLRLKRGAASTV